MTVRLEVVAAEKWADRVATELAQRIHARPSLRLCLPSGDTPSPVYHRLRALSAAGEVSFGGVTVVLLDEFLGLSPADPARCDARLERELLSGLESPPAVVHTIDVDAADPAVAARAHDAVAAAGLDLALLGLGMNGHVGLNEPGCGPGSGTRIVSTAPATRDAALDRYGANSAPTAGITLGLDRLLDAEEVWLLVSGARKADVLERTLHAPESGDIPATFLRRHPRLWVIADEPAAARL